ncbi:MAG: phosphatase PAP2 family protein [Bernardetiaceae bacterium]
MLDRLRAFDEALFCALHSLHHPMLDGFMVWATGKWSWLPLYALWLGLLAWQYRGQVWRVLLVLVLLITATDRISSGLMKPFFGRLRPCHEPLLDCSLDLLTGCGGQYGFVSSHAANAFGVAMLLSLLWRQKISAVLGLFSWAVLVSYTRVYVGVHYPGDVLGGALLGITLGGLAYGLFNKSGLKPS